MDIQWYPGHMAKATRLIREELKNIDIVLLIGDARCVSSSINRDFLPIVGSKKITYIFNKSDLADESVTEAWRNYFRNNDIDAIFTDMLNKKGLDKIKAHLKELQSTFRYAKEAHVLIAGIPNVGKSMIINSLAGRAAAQTGNTPGLTKANKWVKLEGNYYLLDSPGIMPPKFTNRQEATALAAIGSIKDTIYDKGELALEVIAFLSSEYPQLLMQRYKLDNLDASEQDILEQICHNRGFVTKGGIFDYDRGVNTLLDEFKNGKIGKISFEKPEEAV